MSNNKKTLQILRTLGNPHCEKALRILAHRRMTVEELTPKLKISQPATSQTLKKLRGIGAVAYEEKGRTHSYGIANAAILGLLSHADGVAGQA